MSRLFTALLLTMLLAIPAAAQTDDRDSGQIDSGSDVDPLFESWVTAQAMLFQNFFQATEGAAEEDVNALRGEVGTSVRLSRNTPLRIYGSFQYVDYDYDLEASKGVRVGLKSEGRPHSFDIYLEQLIDTPSFDVGDEFDRGDVRTLAGEYGLRFVDDWQLTLEGQLQEQEFDLSPTRENEFHAYGAALRYRGWRQFSPEVGIRVGEREVDDATLSYEQQDTYLQIRSSLSRALYLSARLRSRDREYMTDDVTSSNFGREDDRRQLSAALDWTLSRLITLNFYGSQEDTDSNIAGKDFDTGLLTAGLTVHF